MKDGGGYVQTTHVRTPVEPPPLKDVVPPLVAEPSWRIRAKTSPADLKDPPLPSAKGGTLLATAREGHGRRRRINVKSSPVDRAGEELSGPPEGGHEPRSPSTGSSIPKVRAMRSRANSRETLASVKDLAQHLLNMEDFTKEGCLELLDKLVVAAKVRTRRGQGCFQAFAYCQGGNRGITVQTRNKDTVVKYLNEYLKRATNHLPEGTVSWATLGVFTGNAIPPHTDVHNERGSWNYVVEVSDGSRRGLWVSGDDRSNPTRGEAEPGEASQALPDGSQCPGRFYNITEKAAGFNPKKFHGFVPNSPNEWLLVGYTPSGVDRLQEEDLDTLRKLGFPLRDVALPDEEEEGDDPDGDDESDEEEEKFPDDPDPDQYNKVSDDEFTDRDDEEPEGNTEPMDAEFVGEWIG